MPNNLRELREHIRTKATAEGLSPAQACYALGWIFYDIFERADHEETNLGMTISPADFDRYARELPVEKIKRDISDAQQEFGRSAAEFMEPEILNRIETAISESIVARIKAYTSGWKTFGFNVLAGLLSGVLFAGITFFGYLYVKDDPSLNAAGKSIIQAPSTNSPAIPPPAPVQQ